MNIDKWCAEQCGVDVHTEGSKRLYIDKPRKHGLYQPTVLWTIEDPRCREIVLQSIMENKDYWCTGYSLIRLSDGYRFILYKAHEPVEGHGKTPEDAQIACITAIYEARDD